jgi:hypothetical protein
MNFITTQAEYRGWKRIWNMSEISATISNFVDSAEKIYTLAMRIKDDLTKYSQS